MFSSSTARRRRAPILGIVFCLALVCTATGQTPNQSDDEEGNLEDFVAAMVKEITQGSPQGQALAFHHLQTLGPKAASAVPALNKTFSHKDSYVRIETALTLWKIEQRAEAIPALIKALKDKGVKAEDRKLAADCLGIIGKPARAAVPALTEALKEKDELLRVCSAWALWEVDGQKEKVRPVVLGLLNSKNLNVVSAASYTLSGTGLDREALAALDASLRAEPGRAAAMERTIPALVKAATGEDAEARKMAISILAGMRSNAPWPGLALRDALDDPNPKVRERAAEALKRVDPEAEGARKKERH